MTMHSLEGYYLADWNGCVYRAQVVGDRFVFDVRYRDADTRATVPPTISRLLFEFVRPEYVWITEAEAREITGASDA